ncbi:MAG TPA: pseudouridine synthase [Polyangiaceae bacterium]|nr:pseudouridine synthase [Polyangiaceae bacterium]
MERLQKVLAQAGIASRRAAEQIILAGRVRVDGKIVRELGTQVDPRKNRVEVDGHKIVAEKLIYIVLHKPRGVVCTLSDPEGRPTIQELLKDAGARVVPVGRLDFHTSGALLCTNDGEFAQALAHPKKHVPKVYVAKVKGAVDDEALEKFSERIVIDGRPTQPAQVKRLRFEGDKTWLEITLREGRNRQVRRLGEATGFPVMRLARISHAGVTSEDLRPGQWRPLTVDELVDLKRDYGVPKKVRAPIFEPALGKGGWSDEPRTPGARRPEPKFSAARRRDAKPKTEGPKFDRKRTPARRDDAVPAVEGRPFNARHTENKRFKSETTEPARFDRKRASRSSREVQGELEQSPGRTNPKRPWEARSRSASDGRPGTNAARPSADRASTRQGRETINAGRGGKQETAKPFNAAHREKKRFNAKNAEPGPFETRPSRSTAKAPFDAKRRPNREAPFQGELGQSPSRTKPNRPWEARSRSASEGRPGTNSARPSADRASGRNGREAINPRRAGDQDQPRADRASGRNGRGASHAKPTRK